MAMVGGERGAQEGGLLVKALPTGPMTLRSLENVSESEGFNSISFPFLPLLPPSFIITIVTKAILVSGTKY